MKEEQKVKQEQAKQFAERFNIKDESEDDHLERARKERIAAQRRRELEGHIVEEVDDAFIEEEDDDVLAASEMSKYAPLRFDDDDDSMTEEERLELERQMWSEMGYDRDDESQILVSTDLKNLTRQFEKDPDSLVKKEEKSAAATDSTIPTKGKKRKASSSSAAATASTSHVSGAYTPSETSIPTLQSEQPSSKRPKLTNETELKAALVRFIRARRGSVTLPDLRREFVPGGTSSIPEAEKKRILSLLLAAVKAVGLTKKDKNGKILIFLKPEFASPQ